MPATDKKPENKKPGRQQKSKQQQQQPQYQSAYDITVKECLVWPSPGNESRDARNAIQSDVVYVSLKAQKQNKSERQQTDDFQGPQRQIQQPDDGRAIDALRGWPRYQRQDPDGQDEDDVELNAAATSPPPPAPTGLKKPAKKPPGKDKAGQVTKSTKRVVIKEPDNIHVPDLIQMRYLHEYMDQRQAELEAERLAKEANERAARQGRRAAKDRRDIKANKAAQLRAIALADRVETSAFDLWKMEKFTKNARPHLSTTSGQRGGGGGGSGGGCSGSVGGSRNGTTTGGRRRLGSAFDDDADELGNCGPCLCPDQHPYYYSEPDFNEVMFDVDDGRNSVDSQQLQSLTAACVACAL